LAELSSPRVAYRGFLSYSHRDGGAASKLHRQLETYRLPKHLTTDGLAPERLSPIFRDREELSAGTDLSAQVQEALAGSDALIILCSPDAKASKWVNKEIETFRALHPDRPLLAAIISGDPETSFPDALTQSGIEPIAADFRPGKDGWRLGRLKLVAGLAGVPLDALVQRDAQRQMRRVTAITVGSLIAVVVLAILLAAAMQARAEAVRQRQQAEGLVEYMLTDLRDRLRGVGRLDVMTAVNERAMGYYASQGSLAALPPESLERRARILHAMGEDDEKRGSLDLALNKFSEAHRTTAAILAKRPKDPEAIFAHAQSEYWVGEVAWRKNDRAKTTGHWQNYLTQAKALAQVEPRRVRSNMELGYAHGNLCDLFQRDAFDLEKALAACLKSLQYEGEAVQKEPSNQTNIRELANRHGWTADVYLAKKSLALALIEREKEMALISNLLRLDPNNADDKQRLIWSQIGSAAVLSESGRSRDAAQLLQIARTELERLLESDRSDSTLLSLKTRILLELAAAQQKSGDEAWRSSLEQAQVTGKAYFSVTGHEAQRTRFEASVALLRKGAAK
jgi:tetratricopeptide (TPR) repeat protein